MTHSCHKPFVIWIVTTACLMNPVYTVPLLAESSPEPVTVSERFERANQSMQQADEAREREQWSAAAAGYHQALFYFEQLIHLNPDWQNTLVRFRYSYCNNQLQAMLQKSNQPAPLPSLPVPPSPPSAQARIRQAVDLIRSGDFARARPILVEGIQADPDAFEARFLLVAIDLQTNRLDDARFLADGLRFDHPRDPALHLLLAGMHLAEGDLVQSERLIRESIRLNPRLPAAQFNLAQLLLLQTPPRIKDARQAYQRSLRLGGTPHTPLEERLKATPAP